MPKKEKQQNILRKVLENEIKGNKNNFPYCRSVLGSKRAVEKIADFYEEMETELEIIYELLQREMIGTEEFENKEQYFQMKRIAGAYPAFLKACHNESIESEEVPKSNDFEEVLKDSEEENIDSELEDTL